MNTDMIVVIELLIILGGVVAFAMEEIRSLRMEKASS